MLFLYKVVTRNHLTNLNKIKLISAIDNDVIDQGSGVVNTTKSFADGEIIVFEIGQSTSGQIYAIHRMSLRYGVFHFTGYAPLGAYDIKILNNNSFQIIKAPGNLRCIYSAVIS